MKKVIVILCLLLILLSGCSREAYEKTTRHEMLTIRPVTLMPSGYDAAEISYRYNGGILTTTVYLNQIAVGDEAVVIHREGESEPKVYLTPEEYYKFYRAE